MRLGLHAYVEPDRRIEAHLLFNEQVRELVAERIAGLFVGEIAAFLAPTHDGVGDAADQLAHGVFALARARLSVEIFAGDDVGGGLRPILRDFHTFLAEDGHALFVADQCGALFPFDRVEWRSLSVRKIPIEHQPSVLTLGLLGAHSRL